MKTFREILIETKLNEAKYSPRDKLIGILEVENKSKPSKREWYEDENNFPAIMINSRNSLTICPTKDKYKLNKEYGFRLATKKELETLYYKDKK